MYDFAHPIEDAVEQITHSICTLEFEDHRPLYDWVVRECEFEIRRRARSSLRSCISPTSSPASATLRSWWRTASWTAGTTRAWCPSRRFKKGRDFTRRSLSACSSTWCGVSKSQSSVDYAMLEYCIREDLKLKRSRVMAVLDPIKLVIDNYPEGQIDGAIWTRNNMENPELGTRTVPFAVSYYIEREDFMDRAAEEVFPSVPR